MLNNFSNDFRTIILLKLTQNLIKQSDSYGLLELKKILTTNSMLPMIERPVTREEIKKRLREEVKEKLGYLPSKKLVESGGLYGSKMTSQKPIQKNVSRDINGNIRVSNQSNPQRKTFVGQNPYLMQIPKQNTRFVPRLYQEMHKNDLPQNLQYLQPTRVVGIRYLDIGKLNPYINDPNVQSVESEGPGEKVYVNGAMGRKPTKLNLSKEEIDSVIDTFSKNAKIPKTEGLFKVVTNNLMLSAMISDSIGSRFVIKKI